MNRAETAKVMRPNYILVSARDKTSNLNCLRLSFPQKTDKVMMPKTLRFVSAS